MRQVLASPKRRKTMLSDPPDWYTEVQGCRQRHYEQQRRDAIVARSLHARPLSFPVSRGWDFNFSGLGGGGGGVYMGT